MVRTLIVMALLASLFFIVQHWQPAAELTADRGASLAVKSVTPSPGEEPNGFNPAVPESLPDVEKGYLFSEKRKVEKDAAPGEAKPVAVEPGPEVLDSVTYTGSLIVGDLRRALVIFQEPTREVGPGNRRPVASRRPGAPPPPPPSVQGQPQNKQLIQGDRLLGYVVALIEPDRIIFEKGEQKVEKFLYDRNKKRLAAVIGRSEAPSGAAPGGIPPEAYAPPEMARAMVASLAASPTASTNLNSGGGVTQSTTPGVGGDGGAGTGPGGSQAAIPATRIMRRSQRLMGADSSFKVPISPVPGRPVPNN